MDKDPPFDILKLYRRAFHYASIKRMKAEHDENHAALIFRLPTIPELDYEFTFSVRIMPRHELVEFLYSHISYGSGCKDISHFCPCGTGTAFYIPCLEACGLCLAADAPEERIRRRLPLHLPMRPRVIPARFSISTMRAMFR